MGHIGWEKQLKDELRVFVEQYETAYDKEAANAVINRAIKAVKAELEPHDLTQAIVVMSQSRQMILGELLAIKVHREGDDIRRLKELLSSTDEILRNMLTQLNRSYDKH